MNKIILLATLTFLTSCSSIKTSTRTNTMQQLQREYNNHQYSRYVMDNLKAQPVVMQKEKSSTTIKLNLLKRQLASRKKRASGQLNGAINQNGLYKASRTTQQQISKLRTKKQSEDWLKTHSSLDAVLTMALRNNLDIQSGKELAQATLAKYDQVSYLDDMLAQYAAFTKDIKLMGSTQKHNKSVNAGFPFPGLQALKSSIIDQAVESSRLALKQTVQDIVTNTRITYYELQFTQQEIAITRKNIKLLKSLKEELKSSYSTNSSELSGILQVDIEIANNHNQLQLAKDKKQTKQARINALLNLSPAFTLGKLDKPKAERLIGHIEQLISKGKANRVEIARLRTDLEKMKRIIQLSEKRFYPDFNAGFSRFQNDKFTSKAKIKKTNFFAKNDAYLNETRAKFKALQSKIRALQNKTADDIQQVVSSYQSQKRTRALYRNKVIPKAKTTLDIAKNLYEVGDSSYLEVIDAQEMILKYRLKSFKALMRMNINKAKLVRLVGSPK